MAREHNEARYVGTRKVYPAISDLQAISDFVRATDTHVATGATETRAVYTVPTGQIFICQMVGGYCYTANPTSVLAGLYDGSSVYYWHSGAYGAAFSIWVNATPVALDAADILRIVWGGCVAGDTLVSYCAGYLIDKY